MKRMNRKKRQYMFDTRVGADIAYLLEASVSNIVIASQIVI
jgi:hypothetical protein